MDNWHTLYNRIAYRKLEVEKTRNMFKKLEAFLDCVIGKQFKITLKKLVNKFRFQEPGSEQNFFCSELVASTYKAIGLLPMHISSSSY